MKFYCCTVFTVDYDIDEIAEYGDELITLTTCSYYTEDGRFVVVGRKRIHTHE